MPHYRKKPIVIEAVKWDGEFGWIRPDTPQWFREAIYTPEGVPGHLHADGDKLRIQTLEGEMTANSGDYIICGVQGEIYPCKPDIFEATYEPV